MKKIQHKRGATFALACQRLDAEGDAVDLTGKTITSDVLSGPTKYALSVTVDNAVTGEFTLIAADTTAWALTDVQTSTVQTFCDIRIEDSTINISETFEIVVLQEITDD
jgi:hypothetical protein